MSDTLPICPSCGVEIPGDAPGGLCPKCVVDGAIPNDETIKLPRVEPPNIDDLDLLFPDYEFLELIGRGGMGAVYKATQSRLSRTVAIKVLTREVADADPTFTERFTREAEALARLNHPNIVGVFDTGEMEGLYYIVMEYVDGANLRQVLEGGKLQPKEALAIVVQVCEALQFAHDAGVVHRDIKPENILLTEDGQAKIADFGLVKLVGPQSAFTLTESYQAMGTMRYMAPEQLSGSGDADHRADIFSLGVVFYELLTGEIPAGRFDPPSKRVEVDVRLDDVVLRTLDSLPERRYQQANDIKTDVVTISSTAAEEPPPAPPAAAPAAPKPAQTTVRPKMSRKAIWGAVFGGFFWFTLAILVPLSLFTVKSDTTMHPVEIGPGGHAVPTIQMHSSGATVVTLGLRLVASLFGLLGLVSPIVATILGFSAISDIRHSSGKISGLALAVADALLLPLLILDALILGIFILIGAALVNGEMNFVMPVFLLAAAGLLVVLVIDLIIYLVVYFTLRSKIKAGR